MRVKGRVWWEGAGGGGKGEEGGIGRQGGAC